MDLYDSNMQQINKLVSIYGESKRKVIENALTFLKEHELDWNLKEQINTDVFIKDIIERVKC